MILISGIHCFDKYNKYLSLNFYFYINLTYLFIEHYGELDNWKAGTTLVQKTHENGLETIDKFGGKGILLLRNPYRAIISYHNFLFGGHKNYAPVANYFRKGE